MVANKAGKEKSSRKDVEYCNCKYAGALKDGKNGCRPVIREIKSAEMHA